MADTVTSQIIDGPRNVIAKFTNFSDGTGEAAVVKVDVTTLNPNPGTHLTIYGVSYDIKGGAVRILWDATASIDALILSGYDEKNFGHSNGWTNNGGAGVTGNIKFTTVSFAANSSYTICLYLKKNI